MDFKNCVWCRQLIQLWWGQKYIIYKNIRTPFLSSPSLSLSIYLSIDLWIYLFFQLTFYLSIHLSIYLSMYSSICLPIYLVYIHTYIYLSNIHIIIYLSFSLALSLTPDLVEHGLVGAEEAPLEHLLLAVGVHHRVADVEHLIMKKQMIFSWL